MFLEKSSIGPFIWTYLDILGIDIDMSFPPGPLPYRQNKTIIFCAQATLTHAVANWLLVCTVAE